MRNQNDYEKDIEKIVEVIKGWGDKVEAVAIGLPADISKDGNYVARTSKYLSWLNQPVVKRLNSGLGCPVYLVNDAVLAAYGVAVYERPEEELVYLTWGTGVGGAEVEWSGKKVAIRPIEWKYLADWERDCGGRSMTKRFGKPATLLNEAQWQEVMDDFGRHLNNFIEKVKRRRIVLGGGMSVKQGERLDKIITKYETTAVALTGLGEEAGLYGGFALVKTKLS